MSLDNGSIGSFDSQAAASRPARGVNRPSGRIVAPEAVPPHPRGALAVRLPRRHRSETPEQGRRSATPPLRRRQRSHTPPTQLEPTPSESVSQQGSSRRSAFAPVREGNLRQSVGENLNRGVSSIGGSRVSDVNTAAALLMNISNVNNPLLSQLVMEANKPKFQGTAVQFSEFRRQWGEYSKLMRSTFPSIGEQQILSITARAYRLT